MGLLIYTHRDPKWAVPKDVTIRLRGRSLWSDDIHLSDIIEFDLSRHSKIEQQLDASMILGLGNLVEESTWVMGMMEDIAGVIIDGKLCVDDEPFWTHKIKEDEIYNLAYIQRPFWWNPLIWVVDRYRKTPLVQEEDIPELNPYWETSVACMRLKRRGLAIGSRDDKKTGHERKRSVGRWTYVPSQWIMQAERFGRWGDVRRWRRFNPAPVKGEPMNLGLALGRKLLWIVTHMCLPLYVFFQGVALVVAWILHSTIARVV